MAGKLNTSVETIRLELARRIVAGELEPGTAIDESSIAAEFKVSRTPVREALRQLASSGLIEQRAHRKALVTKPDEETLSGMFAVMGYLESLCAGLCAINMSARERRQISALHDRMETMVHSGDRTAYTLANEDFHAMIYDGTRNAYLAEITRATRQRVQPFRRAQFGALGRLAASHVEHTAILDGILQGNREAAEERMKAHIGFVETAWNRLSGSFQPPESMKALQEP